MLKDKISDIYDIPCYLVGQGYGSFITFEFGEPHLEIKEPNKNAKIEGLHYRHVSVSGKWHLWIYCCDWDIYLNQKLMAHSESSRQEIEEALRYIDGQKIKEIEIDQDSGDTNFHFDLGGLLKTKHYVDGINEQWFLYGPDYILTIRSDGTYCYQNRKHPNEVELWKKIK